MVPIKELSDQDIEALIDYVIYLSCAVRSSESC